MSRGEDILLKARTHFRATRTVESLRKVDVPEWDTEIYFWPEMDVAEKRAVWANLRPGQAPSTADLMDSALAQVLYRSRDAFGERLFDEGKREALEETHPDVLMRIANEMGWRATSLEEAEKN